MVNMASHLFNHFLCRSIVISSSIARFSTNLMDIYLFTACVIRLSNRNMNLLFGRYESHCIHIGTHTFPCNAKFVNMSARNRKKICNCYLNKNHNNKSNNIEVSDTKPKWSCKTCYNANDMMNWAHIHFCRKSA